MQKQVFRVGIVLFLTVLASLTTFPGSTLKADTLHFVYQSPKSGSIYNSPKSSILVKPGDTLLRSSVLPSIFRVVGSISGIHLGKVTLARDQRTVCFKPSIAFANSERVTVQVHAGLKTKAGKVLGSTTFSFLTSALRKRITALAQLRDSSVLQQDAAWDRTFNIGSGQSEFSRTMELLAADSLSVDTLLNIDVNNSPSDGAIFLSSFESTLFKPTVANYLLILSNAGAPIFYRKMAAPAFDFKVQQNGMLTYYDSQRGYFLAMDSQYNVIDSFMCGDGYSTDVHDLELLPNHHALLFAQDTELVDMSQYITGGSPKADVIGCIVQEIDSEKNVVFQWRSWDYYKITDAIHQNLMTTPIDYVHANSIQMDTEGNIILSARHLSEVTKISRDSGGIIWRLGGQHNQFTFVNDAIADSNNGLGFSYQHAVRRIANGDITIFDNGNYQKPHISRAVEYHLDIQRMTAALVWQFRHTPDAYSPAMGYVQRLENGNTFIGWGIISNPAVTEVKPDGSTAWEMDFAPPSVSYRAFRFPWNPSTATVARNSSVASFHLNQNYPNPFGSIAGAGATTINYSLERPTHVTLGVYDIMGREVIQLINQNETPGDHRAILNMAQLPTGTYSYRLSAGGRTETRSMVFIR